MTRSIFEASSLFFEIGDQVDGKSLCLCESAVQVQPIGGCCHLHKPYTQLGSFFTACSQYMIGLDHASNGLLESIPIGK